MSPTTCFRLTLLVAAIVVLSPGVQRAVADDASISGSFTGNGQKAKLAYVSAYKKVEEGDTRYIITFTEKDHSKEKKPDFKAGFGDFGSALIVVITPDGKIAGNTIAHTAHKKSGFVSLGNLAMSDFKIADGKMQGKLATTGEQETFGEKWEVKDLKFQTKAP